MGNFVQRARHMLNECGRALGGLGRTEAQRNAGEGERRFRSTFDLLPVGVSHIDIEGRILLANPRMASILGYAPGELDGRMVGELVWPEDQEIRRELQQRRAELHAGKIESFSKEIRYRHKRGFPVWVGLTIAVQRDAAGRPLYDVSVVEDISPRKRDEKLLALGYAVNLAITQAESESSAIKAAIQAICEEEGWECGRYWRVDANAGVLRLAETWCLEGARFNAFLDQWSIVTYPRGEGLAGRAWLSGEPQWAADIAQDARVGQKLLSLRSGMRGVFAFPVISGEETLGVLVFNSLEARERQEELVQAIGMIGSQIGQFLKRKQAEEQLARLAQFDALTGLPNRLLFHDRLTQAMAQAKRSGELMAMLFIDLDRFKLVNDTLGHARGDHLLKEAAARLQQCLRSGDTVARLGGDEFGAILTGLGASGDAGLVAHKIIEALERPFDLDRNDVYVTASIGITVFPADGEAAEPLIMNADTAMYRAKEQGRNTYQYFTREMNERAIARVRTEAALRRAIERREFRLHYQPRVELRSGAFCGMEALLRWQHPERGLVEPGEFVPVLEDAGLIVQVGEWVLREVCRQIRAWKGSRLAVPPVAVNLSARQFQQKDLESTVREILQETGTDPSLIEFELTESLLMKDPEAAARTLRGLKRSGIRLSVDDFGTGYSSLAYLKRFPIDALKIDRAFIRDVTTDPDDTAIVLSIIALAHSLKLRVVAEGVETEEQLRFLRAHACDEMQGFHSARPVEAAGLTALLREGWRLKL